MPDSVEPPDLRSLQHQVTIMATVLGQALAALAASDPVKRDVLDSTVAKFEGAVTTAAGQHVMSLIRDGMDVILSAGRAATPDVDL